MYVIYVGRSVGTKRLSVWLYYGLRLSVAVRIDGVRYDDDGSVGKRGREQPVSTVNRYVIVLVDGG